MLLVASCELCCFLSCWDAGGGGGIQASGLLLDADHFGQEASMNVTRS